MGIAFLLLSSTVNPVLVPEIHPQSALVQTSVVKEKMRPVTSSPRRWSRDSPTSNSFYILLLRFSQLTSKVLAYLASNGCKSLGGVCPERMLYPSLQTETPFHKVPSGSKWLHQSSKEPVLKRSLTQSVEQVGSRKSGCQVVNWLFLVPKPN